MRRLSIAALTAAASLLACGEQPPPASSYFDENIEPIFREGCIGQTTGCHLADSRGVAAGNLDLSSYDSLMRRRDVLPAYGPYPVGLLLMKAGPAQQIAVGTFDAPDAARPDQRTVQVTTDVRHNAGLGLDPGSAAFRTLKAWVQSGFARSGAVRDNAVTNDGSCSARPGIAPGFDPGTDPADTASFQRFLSDVQPVLRQRCSGSACHGAALADFYLSCGETAEQRRWNYFIGTEYLDDPVSRSELLLRPLAVAQGGTYHGGGDVFRAPSDDGYRAIAAWATALLASNPDVVHGQDATDGSRFFANRVQPLLVRKGCLFLNCHSPLSFHELKLRGGAGGGFSRATTRRNYDLSRHFLALESPDPNVSRIIGKNLYPPQMVDGGVGIVHRGGALFEDFAQGGPLHRATPGDCAGVDADHGDLDTIPAYCVFVRWHQIERRAAIASGGLFPEDQPLRSVVYVARPLGVGATTDFVTYRPGADLRVADATLAADGSISLGAPRTLMVGCGLSSANTDIRHPAVSWDGTRIAFAARTGASTPWRLYWMDADGSRCERIPDVAPATDEQDGILLSDFDPAWAPDGRIVFASTRGNLDAATAGWTGPSLTPASLAPNANLYVYEPAEATRVRQLTFLLNQELSPGFLQNGRVIFTAEKREPGFSQLALRRQNLDGGDYHPLFAQRQSVGFRSGTSVVQLLSQDLAFVAGPMDATDGAGTIAIVNRTIGPDQSDRDPEDRFYLHSMHLPAPGAFGSVQGVFRSPAALPSSRVLASCDPGATDLHGGPFDFDLCELDPATGAVRVVAGERGVAEVDAVAVFARLDRGVYTSRSLVAEANAQTRVEPGQLDAQVYFTDFPMIATLLFSNTRMGRPIDPRIRGFDVLEELPPPSGTTSFAEVADRTMTDDYGQVFVDRHVIGHVGLLGDGSVRFRFPGGTALLFRVTDADGRVLDFEPGSPFDGPMVQREQIQYYPGERITQSIPRRFFNGICGGCHGAITGREVDVAVSLDVIAGASETLAKGMEPVDIFAPPGSRRH